MYNKGGIKAGEDYKYIKKSIAINLLDYNFYKRNSYHNIAHMMFEETRPEEYVNMGYKIEEQMATKDIEMHFIELPKFIKKNPEVKTKLEQWLWLIVGREEKLEMAKKENKELEKAIKIIKEMSTNTEEWENFVSRQKAIINYNSGMSQAKEEGLTEGRKEGEKIGKMQVAKELLKHGMKSKKVQEITGLSDEEIQKLNSNN